MKKITLVLALFLFVTAGANAVESRETHQMAATAHGAMNNAQAPAHQQMMQQHRQQMGQQAAVSAHAASFSEMNEHERAAVVQESLNNGSAWIHQQQAAKHRQQIPAL